MIDAIPPGGALQITMGDGQLEAPLRAHCQGRGLEFLDVSEAATLCYQIYRRF